MFELKEIGRKAYLCLSDFEKLPLEQWQLLNFYGDPFYFAFYENFKVLF